MVTLDDVIARRAPRMDVVEAHKKRMLAEVRAVREHESSQLGQHLVEGLRAARVGPDAVAEIFDGGA